jgi:hypothetical protein
MALRTSLVVSVVLALAGGVASADSKVDWSQYIDKDAKTSPAPASTPPPVVAQNSKPAKASKKVAAKAKTASKAKRGARRHH